MLDIYDKLRRLTKKKQIFKTLKNEFVLPSVLLLVLLDSFYS